MSAGWAFAAGWIGCNVFIAWMVPSPFAAIASAVKAALPKRPLRWTIGGVRYTARPLTRTVMEEVSHLQQEIGVPTLVPFMPGDDAAEAHDQLRRIKAQQQAAAIESSYAVCAAVIQDENGDQPSVEWLGDVLTIDEVNRIVARVMNL